MHPIVQATPEVVFRQLAAAVDAAAVGVVYRAEIVDGKLRDLKGKRGLALVVEGCRAAEQSLMVRVVIWDSVTVALEDLGAMQSVLALSEMQEMQQMKKVG